MWLRKYIPSIEWISTYQRSDLRGDLIAGITVAVMLIPQGMAYAMIAGLPPIYGLYASVVPLIIYGFLGTSRQLAVGPVAMISLLVAAGVGTIAGGSMEVYIAAAILLALIVGGIQVIMGLFRLGFLVTFISHPVIQGFTAAAALIIGFSQLKHLLGINIPRSHHIHEILLYAAENINTTHLITLAIGLGSVFLILFLKRVHKAIPGALVAVVISILLVWGLGLEQEGVKIIGDVPGGLAKFSVPEWNWEMVKALAPIALTIALIGFMESIAVAKSMEAKHKTYRVDANQELVALGFSNVVGSFFQSYPVTGGFSRTAVNDQAGAKTTLASMITAALILVALLFLTPLFYYLPNAVLAAVIMVAVFGLIHVKEIKKLYVLDKKDFAMFLVTFAGTLALGIEEGILIGAVLSLGVVIYATSRPHYAILGRVPDKGVFKNIKRFPESIQRQDILIFRFDARLYYANTDYFEDELNAHIERAGDRLKLVILDCDAMNSIDTTALERLHRIHNDLTARGLILRFVGLKGPVRDAFSRAGYYEEFGEEHFFMTNQDAIDAYDKKTEQNGHSETHQKPAPEKKEFI